MGSAFCGQHRICLITLMKNLAYPLLLVLVLAVSCTKVKEPDFRRIGNFKMKQLGFQEATVGFSVTYFNPNNFGVAVKETAADIYMDTVFLGRFVQDSSINVGRNAEFSIPLTGSVPLKKILNLNLQNIDSREIVVRADGDTRVGKAGIFVTKKIRYEGRHKLSDINLKP